MKKVLVALFLLVSSMSAWSQCFDPYVNIGIRGGYELGFGMAPLFDPNKDDSISITPAGLVHNPFINFQLDIRLLEWFSIAPEVNVSFFKRAVDKDAKIQAKWNEINFSALALFHVGVFYAGLGPGFTINSKPRYTTTTDHLNSTVADPGNSLKELGLKTKTSARFTLTTEIGFLIPVGYDGFNVQLGFRSTIAPIVMDKLFSAVDTQCEEDNRLNGFANRGTTFASFALFAGLVYSFE